MSMGYLLRSLILLFALCANSATSADVTSRPTVLELFTSEGCSSCPPAEIILNELAQRPDVLALSFHVDYWDDLGWRDRYSLAEATERQRQYARSLHQSSVYTPEVVVDGSGGMVGSARDSVTRAVSGGRSGIAISMSILSGSIQVNVGRGPGATSADVLLLGYLREATTHIGRGENSGRTLKESNVVRVIHVLGRWDGKSRDFQLGVDTLPPDVTDVAVLVQAAGQGVILGAVAQPIH